MKRKKIFDVVNVDGIILINQPERVDPNFVYLTNIRENEGVYFSSKDEEIVYTSILEYDNFKKNSCIKDVVHSKSIYDELKETLNKKKVGLNFSLISVNELDNLKKKFSKTEFVDISKEFSNVRAIKTDDEIEIIRKSCKYADEIMKFAVNNANGKVTEKELKRKIDYKMEEMDLKPSFNTIVATSKNAGCPHHVSRKDKLKGFTVIDLGVLYKNYCSDMTRTIYVGKPDKKEIEIYDKVRKVQEKCIGLVKIGAKCSDIYDEAKKVLGDKFVHGLGHGIGIEVHESPYLSKMRDELLKENNVVTVEPGYYDKNLGIRIEDDLLVNKKVELLTNYSKELIRI